MTTSTPVLLPPVRPVRRPVEGPTWWRRRRRPRPHRRRRALRVLLRTVATVLVLTLALAGWLGTRAALGVSALAAAQPALEDVTRALEGGDGGSALQSADEVRAAVGRARELIDEPVWRAAEHLPWLGPRLHAVRAGTEAADILATEALGPAIALADTISRGPYGEGAGFAELVRATELRGDLDAVAEAVLRARTAVHGATTDLLVPDLSAPFAQSIDMLDQAAEVATGLGPGLDLLLDVSGYPEEAVTAVVVLDDRTARPLGGEIQAAYVVSAERGGPPRLDALDPAEVRAAATAGPSFAAAAEGPQQALLATPDVARLAVTADAGAALADGVAAVAGVAPRSVVLVTTEGLDTLHAPAARDPDTGSLADALTAAPADQRGAVLEERLRRIVQDVLALRAPADEMVLAVGEAVGSGALRVWSADPELQAELSGMRGGGGLPADGAMAVAVTGDDGGAPSRLTAVRLTTATGQCGFLWTRRSEAVLTVEVADVPGAAQEAVPQRLLVAVPAKAVVLGVAGPAGAVPHEVIDLGAHQLVALTPTAAGEATVRLAGGTQQLERLDVVTRGGVPAAEHGAFTCVDSRG